MGEQTVGELMMMNEETGEVTKFEGLTNVTLSTEQPDEVEALTGTEFILTLAEKLGATITLNSDTPGISVNEKLMNFRELMGLPTHPVKRREHVSKKRFKKILMANRLGRKAADFLVKHINMYHDVYDVTSYKEFINKHMERVYL